jgi:hypothetical protein
MRIIQSGSEHSTGIDLPRVIPSFPTDGVSCLTVYDVLRPNRLLSHLSILDTCFSRPTCENMMVKLHISFMDCNNMVQTKFALHQMVSGADCVTPRSALSAALRSSHIFRLWQRDRWGDGSEWACQWVRQTDVLDFIECTEELEEVTAVVDVLTSFVLCDTIVPTERDWAAVESEKE